MTKELTKVVQERIRSLRESKGLSQDKMAELMGLSQTAYSRFERHERKADLAFLEKAANALKVPVGDLVSEADLDDTAPLAMRSESNKPTKEPEEESDEMARLKMEHLEQRYQDTKRALEVQDRILELILQASAKIPTSPLALFKFMVSPTQLSEIDALIAELHRIREEEYQRQRERGLRDDLPESDK